MVGKIIKLPRELATQFSRHILSNGFDQSFEISVVFQNGHHSTFCLSCHVLIIYTCIELQAFTQHPFRNVFTVVTWTVSTLYELSARYMNRQHAIWSVSTLYELSARYMNCQHAIWNVSTLYEMSARYMNCQHAIWTVSTLYEPSAHYMNRQHAIWTVSKLYELSSRYMNCKHAIWTVSTLYELSARYMNCQHALWTVSTLYELSARYMNCQRAIWTVSTLYEVSACHMNCQHAIWTVSTLYELSARYMNCQHAIWTVSTLYERTNPSAQSDRSNVQLTSHNSVQFWKSSNKFIPQWHTCSISRTEVGRRENLYFTETKAIGIVIFHVQFVTLSLIFRLGLDIQKCLFL
jgi:hypothetical protein